MAYNIIPQANLFPSSSILICYIDQMGVVCAPVKAEEGTIEGAEDYIAQSKSYNSIEDRISEMKEFLSLKKEDVQQIAPNQTQTLNISDFEIKQFLAKGGFGKVYTAEHVKTGKVYAMKIINKSVLLEETTKLQTISERLILQNLDHPFLVRLHYAFHSSSKIFMLVDYIEKGQLFYIMRSRGKFTEDEARFYAAQIFLAIEYLHKKNIMYRDLKPENVLVGADGHLKVTDFGISKVFANNLDVTYSMCGTPEYIAPQVLRQKGYTFSSDWFSFGALVYDMITGKPPFYSKNQVEMVEQKLQKSSVPLPKKIKPETKSFLQGLLNFNPSQRLGALGSDQIRNHPFFASIDFEKLLSKEVSPPSQIYEALGSITVDCLAENKSQSLNSTVLARTVRSKLNKQLKFAGFEFNKQRRNVASFSSLNQDVEFVQQLQQ